VPVFDRDMELSRAAAAIITPGTRFLIVEGNYLLFDEQPWRQLGPLFDFSVFLDVPRPELERRLAERWHVHGKTPQDATAWIAANDLPNIELVLSRRRRADLVLESQ